MLNKITFIKVVLHDAACIISYIIHLLHASVYRFSGGFVVEILVFQKDFTLQIYGLTSSKSLSLRYRRWKKTKKKTGSTWFFDSLAWLSSNLLRVFQIKELSSDFETLLHMGQSIQEWTKWNWSDMKWYGLLKQKVTFELLMDFKQSLWKLEILQKPLLLKVFFCKLLKHTITFFWQCFFYIFMRQTLTDDFGGYTKIWIACFF